MGFLKNIAQRLYPCGTCRVGKAVYLTFDDGPIPEVTPKVLEILSRYGVKATFFMVGENIDKHPDVFAEVVKAGHAIANPKSISRMCGSGKRRLNGITLPAVLLLC